MNNTLADIYGDSSYKKFMKIAQETEIPTFVKEGSLSSDGYNELGPDAFGDPGKRKYPLNNKSNTWVSREFFEKEKGLYDSSIADVIGGRIQKAAEFWKLEDATKVQAPDEEYHPISAKHAGREIFRTNVSHPQHYKEAVDYLVENKSKMTYEMRRTFARDLYNTPESMQCALGKEASEYIEKAAGFGMATNASLMTGIMSRVAHLYRNYPDLSNKLVKMAKELKGMEYTPATLNKVASMLDVVDRAVDLHRYYDHGHTTPEESVFTITQKMAQEFTEEAIKLQTGNVIGKTALLNKKSMVDEFFESYMGEKPYDSDEEMVAIVASLPRDDAAALENSVSLKGMKI
jgi:hypothetical protein